MTLPAQFIPPSSPLVGRVLSNLSDHPTVADLLIAIGEMISDNPAAINYWIELTMGSGEYWDGELVPDHKNQIVML